jgi:hypothetical protein
MLEHAEHVDAFTAEIDAFFAALPVPKAQAPDAFVAELRAALPKRWAAKAEDIWREHAAGAQGSNTVSGDRRGKRRQLADAAARR